MGYQTKNPAIGDFVYYWETFGGRIVDGKICSGKIIKIEVWFGGYKKYRLDTSAEKDSDKPELGKHYVYNKIYKTKIDCFEDISAHLTRMSKKAISNIKNNLQLQLKLIMKNQVYANN